MRADETPFIQTIRRVPWWGWLLAFLAPLAILFPAGVLDLTPEYRASIGPGPHSTAPLTVLIYGDRYETYLAQDRLDVPSSGWTLSRGDGFVRFEAAPGAAPLRVVAKDEPVYVSLLRHARAGAAAVDGGPGQLRTIDLRAPQESVQPLVIGGPESLLPANATSPRLERRYLIPATLLTYLLSLGIVLRVWAPAVPAAEAVRLARAAALRQSWADLSRVLAIFGVIVIHTCGRLGFYEFGSIPRQDWLWATLLDSVVRCAVPLFVLLSGALLARPGAEIPGPRQVGARVLKVLVPLLAWNVFHLVYNGAPVRWLGMLREPPMYHLWFVYMIIGLYLLLPILQAVVNAVAGRPALQAYLLALWLLLTCAPLYASLPLLRLLHQTSLLGYGGFFVIGAVMASRPPAGPSWPWAVVFLASVAATFLLTRGASDAAGAVVETAFHYFSANVIAASVAAFVLLGRVRPGPRAAGVLHWISDRSFLVFFMHVVVLERVMILVPTFAPGLPRPILLPVVALVTFGICLAASAVLRLLPKAKEVLG